MQNTISCVNVISEGSPILIRSVRRISFGMTTRPRSSILLTMPVAFILCLLLCFAILGLFRFFKANGIVCRGREFMHAEDFDCSHRNRQSTQICVSDFFAEDCSCTRSDRQCLILFADNLRLIVLLIRNCVEYICTQRQFRVN